MFAYNGFQIVQLSERARDINDIPKGIYAAIGSSTSLYAVVALSVIALLGIKTASSSIKHQVRGNKFSIKFKDRPSFCKYAFM